MEQGAFQDCREKMLIISNFKYLMFFCFYWVLRYLSSIAILTTTREISWWCDAPVWSQVIPLNHMLFGLSILSGTMLRNTLTDTHSTKASPMDSNKAVIDNMYKDMARRACSGSWPYQGCYWFYWIQICYSIPICSS